MPVMGYLWRLFFQHRSHGFCSSVATEGADARKHFVQHRTEGEDVGARIGGLAAYLLGRHIARRTHDHAHRGVRAGAGES